MRLFDRYTINGKLELVNRIVVPPMVTRLATDGGDVTDRFMERYVRYARGGPGMVVTEPLSIIEQKSGQLPRLSHDRFVPGVKELVRRVHEETESKIGVQVIHFLKISRSAYRQKVEDLSLEEVKKIPGLFADAVYRARQAGVDTAELHFAHAYTIASFLSRHNQRRDDYGGSLERRLRLAGEVVTAVRKAVGEEFVIGARINGDEFTLGGNTLEHSRPIALRLAASGLDYLSISGGGKFEDGVRVEGKPLSPYSGYSGARAMPFAWMPQKVNVYLASDIRRTLREAGHRIPVVTAGRIPTADVAESILQSEDADLVAVGRPMLADPDWPRKYREGRANEIVQCIYCNRCRDAEGSFQETVCFQTK
ncbi:MAG: NADH:flavin oxidoreductase [Deltaproteobacteria bacterium]|nr:NADH:flavin oxidoreductase [Deltaproteobacteria bacterium]